MNIFNKQNNKDIVKRMDNLNEKLDLVHKSVGRIRIDLPHLLEYNKEIKKREGLCN